MKLFVKPTGAIFTIGIFILGLTLSASAQVTGSTRPSTSDAALQGGYIWSPGKSQRVVDAVRGTGLTEVQRQEVSTLLKPSDRLSIEVKGTAVTVSDGNAQETFATDGRIRTDSPAGPRVRVRASLSGNELTVSKTQGTTDLTTVYILSDDGENLIVTKTVIASYLRDSISVESVYDRTSRTANLTGASSDDDDPNTYSSNDPVDRPNDRDDDTVSTRDTPGSVPNTRDRRPSNRPWSFAIPNGTMIIGTLDNSIITGVTQNNDRFKLTITSPNEYRGAVISGYVSGVASAGRVSGRSKITFNFETITLTNGRVYDFGGYVTSIKDTKGNTVKVDSEGTARSDSQTQETVRRTGIGAGVGAIIGGIIGGGKGAAVGAIIGGGAGAGSVMSKGKEELELMQGSIFTIQASSPR